MKASEQVEFWDNVQANVKFDCKRSLCSLSPGEVLELVEAVALLEVV